MKRNKIEKCIVPVSIFLIVLMIGYGCGQNPNSTTLTTTYTVKTPTTVTTTGTTTTASSIVLQQYKNLAAVFHALITFSVNPDKGYPTDLSIPAVPIIWTGMLFSGRLQESGPGEDITDTITGSTSADGKTLITLVYSRKIMRTNNTGTFYSVALQNVPLSGLSNAITSGFSGAVIQSYVTSIQYADGTVSSGQIVASNNYVSTDWTNAQQPPTLTLTFGK